MCGVQVNRCMHGTAAVGARGVLALAALVLLELLAQRLVLLLLHTNTRHTRATYLTNTASVAI